MEFIYKDKKYPVEIVKKRQNKNTYLRVKKDLTLYITTNLLTDEKAILKLIEENYSSIASMYEKELLKQSNNTGFYYLGKKYDIIYINGNDITLGENKAFVGKSVDIDEWYKKRAKVVFKDYFDKCYESFTRKIPYPRLRIRKMTSRWGVCNYKDIIVTLNLELIKRDVSCLEYVIYHELSHLIEANHSKAFWSLVEENYPNYKQIKTMMKTY